VCGIAGIFHHRAEARIEPRVLEAMRDAMAHRGPDGAGLWLSPSGRTGLAFRRLSILDLSDSAQQPMANEDGSVRLTFNGEIYNHAPLRRELLAAGHVFRTDHSDTEVLVHGFEQWGIEGLLQRIDGMFAMAVWDERAGELHLVRDRIGIKPLYFTQRAGKLLWASEIKGLLEHPEVPREVEEMALNHYLTFMTTPAPLTMFKGIYKLPAAHRMTVRAGAEPRMERWWDVMRKGQGLFPETDERFYLDETRRLMEASVASHMMSDVPYGAFLSGGVDSSSNVALMKRYSDKPVNTFTVGFSDHTQLNELDYARQVARRFGTVHHEVLIDEADMTGYLDQLAYSQDEPLADWVCIPLYFVSRLVRDSGTTVVQVGEGADEQFCGYGSYLTYLQLHRRCFLPFGRLPGPVRRGAAALMGCLADRHPGLEPHAELVQRAAAGREAFWSGALVYHDSHKRKLIPDPDRVGCGVDPRLVAAGLIPPEMALPDSFGIVKAQFERIQALVDRPEQLTRMIYAEFQLRLPELLLMRVDKITMSASIEARVPFLDHRLVEFSMRVPMAMKLKGGMSKFLMKKVAEDFLPKEIIYRRKMGFGAPMADWLRGGFGLRVEAELLASDLLARPMFNRGRIRELLARHRAGRQDNSTQIWTLYNLVCWHRRWIGGA